MKDLIEGIIRALTAEAGAGIYREPLFGYAAASNPIFIELKTAVGPNHFHPRDLLGDAETVFAFFLPFQKHIIESNRTKGFSSRQWAEVYIATNKLISQIYAELESALSDYGVSFVSQPPTYAFDRERLISNWSHRHIAYACGLGSFGRNNLLITAKGSGGRFGSGVMNIALEPNPVKQPLRFCLGTTKGCRYCEKVCPVQAFHEESFNRQRCYGQCLLNDAHYSDLELSDVCGKCATGPCSYID